MSTLVGNLNRQINLGNMVCNPHRQKMKTLPRKLKLRFELEEPKIHQMSLIILDLLMASIVQWPPDINAESSPLSIFIHLFRQIFQFILQEMNHCFHQYMATKSTGSTSAQPSDMVGEIYTFFVRHGSLKDYWSREEQYSTQFYSDMARNHFFPIQRFSILKTMTTLQAVTTQSTIDFGKQERYFIC
jgi:hypothetical protein